MLPGLTLVNVRANLGGESALVHAPRQMPPDLPPESRILCIPSFLQSRPSLMETLNFLFPRLLSPSVAPEPSRL